MKMLLLSLIPSSDRREAALQVLQSVVPATLAKPGCLHCSVYVECDADRSILYMEQWISEEDLHAHIKSNQFFRILTAMDLAEAPPQIRFVTVTDTQQLELIQALRGANIHS